MYRLGIVALLWGLGLGLSSCRNAAPRPLPDHLAAVVRLSDGYASLLLSLPPPGGEGRVRVAPGVFAIGPGWVSQVVAGDGGALRFQQHTDAASRMTLVLPSPDALLLSVDRDQVTYALSGERVRLELGSAAPTMLSDAWVQPGGRMAWSGPRNGFLLRLLPAEGRLQLLLPRSSSGGFDIASGVDALLGSWWLRIEDLPAWELALIQERFRVQSPIPVQDGAAVVDGLLDEWRSYTAVPVEDPSQVVAGAADWTSARDASFGATALRVGADLLLAVRVRDDHFQDDADQLQVILGTWQVVLPLSVPGEGAARSGEGWRAQGVVSGRLDRVVELVVEGGAERLQREDAALEVRYRDVDPGEGGSVLTNAPWPSLLGVSPHHLGTLQP